MYTVRECGCKGQRSCLQCEEKFDINKPTLYRQLQELEAWSFCPACCMIYPGWNPIKIRDEHPIHNNTQGEKCPGVLVQENFLTSEEGIILMKSIDSLPWANSQSGRRKQNYGPKTNFKKRKLRLGDFNGFPYSTKFVQEKLENVECLKDFQTIEQCSLEYDPLKGASIDPHVDDCWIWGERVVTVNCLGNSILTLTLFNQNEISDKYNLFLVDSYNDSLIMPLLNSNELEKYKKKVIRIPMPNLSLIVLYGPARYQFEHSVLREDIKERRVCIAYREFTPMYITGSDKDLGDLVNEKAKNFWNDLAITKGF